MYRPDANIRQGNPIRATLFSQKNYDTLQTVLIQDFQRRNNAPLNDTQINRLSKTLQHYLQEVYDTQGDKPVQVLNKEVLSATAQDFSKYIQRKEAVRNVAPIKTVMDDSLFQEVGQRYERLTQERNETKALPPTMPDFRVSLTEDGSSSAAELFELAKKQREMEALRAAQASNDTLTNKSQDASIQRYVNADTSFRSLQDTQNRMSQLALVERQNRPREPINDAPLVVMPDRRELMLAPMGSFDTMTASPMPRDLGNANSNMTIVQPIMASPVKTDLPQNYIVREERTVSYKEIENNLFIYSGDRDWLKNNKENRYNFTVNFDPGNNGQSFGPSPSAQQKFKNIVRIEFVKAILPCEGLDVLIKQTATNPTPTYNTSYQDNVLSFPYVTVRIAELENNNFGTDNFLDRSFGVLQYDANWISDTTASDTRGYVAMIPKFLKCEKVYHPTPLSTLQKMTIDIHRPNGDLISNVPDTIDIFTVYGSNQAAVPNFNTSIFTNTLAVPPGPNYFFIQTASYFSKFQIAVGDRIQINGFTYDDATLEANAALRDFIGWLNQNEGHIVAGIGYTNPTTGTYADGANNAGYANFIIIQARYTEDTLIGGSTDPTPFIQPTETDINALLIANQANKLVPSRLINLNRQIMLVFRIITREMDALPQLRPDNNY